MVLAELISSALQRHAGVLEENLPYFEKVQNTLLDIARERSGDPDYGPDMFMTTYLVTFAIAMEYKPDVIIEIGRALGNSTSVFSRYKFTQHDCTFYSFSLEEWDVESQRLSDAVDGFQYDPDSINLIDIRLVDFEKILAGKERVLVFWDAHGFDVSDGILSQLFPHLADRQNLVLMDDVFDARYDYDNLPFKFSDGYADCSVWKGCEFPNITTLRFGYLASMFEEGPLLYDFACRNDMPLYSFRHALEQWRTKDPEAYVALNSRLHFQLNPGECSLVYCSLDEAARPALTFPSPSPSLLAALQSTEQETDSSEAVAPPHLSLIRRVFERARRLLRQMVR